MVQKQIRGRGVRDALVLKAMEKVPRHTFVPEEDLATAYGDHPIGIGCNQTISQPYIVAYMTAALGLTGEEKILEIGTGCGYQTAVLAEIVQKVYTIEIHSALSEQARKTLLTLGYEKVVFKTGDGKEGWPEEAPFDGVLVTAAPEELPGPFMEQLRIGGRLVIPIGYGDQDLMRYVRTKDRYTKERLLSVRFVPLL